MPRPKVAEPSAAPQPNVLLASAYRVSSGKGTEPTVYRTSRAWQDEAWGYYHQVPELHYAANWLANVCSRAVLSCVKRAVDGLVSSGSTDGIAALGLLFGGREGQARMLAGMALHLTVVGEVYVIGTKTKDGYDWLVLGTKEVQPGVSGQWKMKAGDGTGNWVNLVPKQDIVIRVWRPSPIDRLEADSPVRGMLETLAEIRRYDMHLKSQAVARLTGSGMLLMPDDLRIAMPPADVLVELGLPPDANEADYYMAKLGKHLVEETRRPGSAEAVVPFVSFLPGDAIEKVRLIHFWSEFDAVVGEQRKESVRRFALGMDMPPEQVLGTGESSSRWGTWQVEESSIKAHVEPLLGLMTGALATMYLRPASGDDEDDIAVDTSALRLRPEHSREALELYALKIVGPKAVRRENGFDENDAMTDEELKHALLVDVAKGSPSPEQVGEAQRQLGVILPVAIEQEANEQRPQPSLEDHPTRDYPRAAALVAASEVMVLRALERAGNRLGNYVPSLKASATPVVERYLAAQEPTPGRLDDMLEGAWNYVPTMMAQYGDPERITAGLDAYARNLITDRAPHDAGMLTAYLRREGVL